MAELSGNLCVLKVSGAATTMTSEATATTDDTVYQISNVIKQVLDRGTAPTVLDGGVATIEVYTVNYLNGKVIFDSADNTRIITVTGKYLPMSIAAYANSASKSKNSEVIDTTVFGNTYKKRIPGLKSASGTLTQLDMADTTYALALTAGVPIVIEQRNISTDEPDRFWALLDSDEIKAAVDGLQTEDVSWVSYDAWINLGV